MFHAAVFFRRESELDAGHHRRRLRFRRLPFPAWKTPQFVHVTALSAVNVVVSHGIGVKDETRIAVEAFHLHVNVTAPVWVAVRFEGEAGARSVVLKDGEGKWVGRRFGGRKGRKEGRKEGREEVDEGKKERKNEGKGGREEK